MGWDSAAVVWAVAVGVAQVGQGGATGDIFECINDGGGPSQGIGILGGSPQIECPRAVLQLNQLLADCAGGSVAGPELSCATMRGSFGDLAAMLNVSCLSTGVKVQQLNQMLLAFGQDLTQGAIAPLIGELECGDTSDAVALLPDDCARSVAILNAASQQFAAGVFRSCQLTSPTSTATSTPTSTETSTLTSTRVSTPTSTGTTTATSTQTSTAQSTQTTTMISTQSTTATSSATSTETTTATTHDRPRFECVDGEGAYPGRHLLAVGAGYDCETQLELLLDLLRVCTPAAEAAIGFSLDCRATALPNVRALHVNDTSGAGCAGSPTLAALNDMLQQYTEHTDPLTAEHTLHDHDARSGVPGRFSCSVDRRLQSVSERNCVADVGGINDAIDDFADGAGSFAACEFTTVTTTATTTATTVDGKLHCLPVPRSSLSVVTAPDMITCRQQAGQLNQLIDECHTFGHPLIPDSNHSFVDAADSAFVVDCLDLGVPGHIALRVSCGRGWSPAVDILNSMLTTFLAHPGYDPHPVSIANPNHTHPHDDTGSTLCLAVEPLLFVDASECVGQVDGINDAMMAWGTGEFTTCSWGSTPSRTSTATSSTTTSTTSTTGTTSTSTVPPTCDGVEDPFHCLNWRDACGVFAPLATICPAMCSNCPTASPSSAPTTTPTTSAPIPSTSAPVPLGRCHRADPAICVLLNCSEPTVVTFCPTRCSDCTCTNSCTTMAPSPPATTVTRTTTAVTTTVAPHCDGVHDLPICATFAALCGTIPSLDAACPAICNACPTSAPVAAPSMAPSLQPSAIPTTPPTLAPSATPTTQPSAGPTATPTVSPSADPTSNPTSLPSPDPTTAPTTSTSTVSTTTSTASTTTSATLTATTPTSTSRTATSQTITTRTATSRTGTSTTATLTTTSRTTSTVSTLTSQTTTSVTTSTLTAGICRGAFDPPVCGILLCHQPDVPRFCPVACGACPDIDVIGAPATLAKIRGRSVVFRVGLIYNTFNSTQAARIFVTVRNAAVPTHRNFVSSVQLAATEAPLLGLPSASPHGGLSVDIRIGSWAITSDAYEVRAYLSTGGWDDRVAQTQPIRMAINDEFADILVPATVHKLSHSSVMFRTTMSYYTGARASPIRAYLIIDNLDQHRGYATAVVLGDTGAPLTALSPTAQNVSLNVTLGSWAATSERYTAYLALSTMDAGWTGRFLTSPTSQFAVINAGTVIESVNLVAAVPQLVQPTVLTVLTLTLEVVTTSNYSIFAVVRQVDTGNRKYARAVTLMDGQSPPRTLASSTTASTVTVLVTLGTWATVAPGYRVDVYLARDGWTTRFASDALDFDLVATAEAVEAGLAAPEALQGGGVGSHAGLPLLVTILGVVSVAILVTLAALALLHHQRGRVGAQTRALPTAAPSQLSPTSSLSSRFVTPQGGLPGHTTLREEVFL